MPGPGRFTAQQVFVFSAVVSVVFPGGAGPVLPVTITENKKKKRREVTDVPFTSGNTV